jgi:hypothetical protein
MKELAFYFFQCVNDRIQAQASLIEMYVVENQHKNQLELLIRDNGKKYDKELIQFESEEIQNKYPALKYLYQTSENLKGYFSMFSHNQTGNLIEIHFPLKNKERLRLGEIDTFLSMLFIAYPQINFIYSQISQKGEFLFDSASFRNTLGDVDFENAEVLGSLKNIIASESAAVTDFA